MTVQENPIPPKSPEEQPKPSESPEAKEKAVRREAAIARERERVAREAESEIGDVFTVHDELRKSIDSVVKAAEVALGHGAALDKKCSTGRLGRRLYLGRRLGVKVALTALSVARSQLKRASAQMVASARLRDSVLEEAVDPELDH